VVEYGARQKMEEWDPEENGGYRIHGRYRSTSDVNAELTEKCADTEAASTPLDPLLALEKSTSQQLHTATYVQPRIEELLEHSDRLNSDPYSHSRRVRKYFREEKKVIKEKERKDDELKERYGLPGEMKLVDEKEVGEEAKEWEKERRAARETSSSNLLSNPSTSKMFKPTHLPSTFAEARKLSSLSSSQPKAPSRSLSSSSSKLSASRQASTLSAVLLRNTIKNANSSSSVAKKIDARSTLGILKK
jgi:coiled-coil domain-containing protein 130